MRFMSKLTSQTNHWLDYPADRLALTELVTGHLKKGAKVLEIGAWLGRTTILFSKLLQGTGSLYVIDNWHGTDFWGSRQARNEASKVPDYFYTFCQNIKKAGFYSEVNILNMSSQEAASLLKDGGFDIVYLDADHRYQSVKRDILNWYPKLKPDGLFIGHDLEVVYSALDSETKQVILRPENENVDFLKIPGRTFNGHPGLHPGTVRAVSEIFNDRVTGFLNSSVWAKGKGNNGQ